MTTNCEKKYCLFVFLFSGGERKRVPPTFLCNFQLLGFLQGFFCFFCFFLLFFSPDDFGFLHKIYEKFGILDDFRAVTVCEMLGSARRPSAQQGLREPDSPSHPPLTDRIHAIAVFRTTPPIHLSGQTLFERSGHFLH